MRYLLSKEFTQINETTGTIQNNSQIYDLEISHTAEPNSGILLRSLNKYSFHDQTIYVRCVDSGGIIEARVIPFIVDAIGASSSTDTSGFDTFDQSDVDDIFKP